MLHNRTISNYKNLTKGISLLVIDEAQHIPDIGFKLKLMVDEIPNLSIIATGSSVFDLSNKLGEPLVGRKHTLWLHPIAQMEFAAEENSLQTKELLETRLIYGSYPELEQLNTLKEKETYLLEMVDSYLLRDILSFGGIRKSDKNI